MSDNHDLAAEIADVLALTKPDAFHDDTPLWRKTTIWIEEIGEAADAVAERVQNRDLADVEAVVTRLLTKGFDEVIVPYDIPGISPMFEQMLESQVRSMIPALVSSAFARLAA